MRSAQLIEWQLERLLLTIDTELRVAAPDTLPPESLPEMRDRLARAYELIQATLLR